MTTAYTSIIESTPNCSLAHYAWRCARAMGALTLQRDGSLDAKIVLHQEPEPYYADLLCKAERNLAGHNAASEDTLRTRYAEERLLADKYYFEAVGAYLKKAAQYKRMMTLVQAWEPPSEDHQNFQNFREFMLAQLRSAIEYDTMPEAPAPLSYGAWCDKRRASYECDVSYYTKEKAKADARCAVANNWLQALVASLGTPPQNDDVHNQE